MTAERRVFHILDEKESFSEFAGGAISRWVGNILRLDQHSFVICAKADESWGLRTTQVRENTAYKVIAGFTSLLRIPVEFKHSFIALSIKRSLKDLAKDDLLWVHNRPEYCLELAKFAHSRGAKIVLHLHNSILGWKRTNILKKVRLNRVVFVSQHLQRSISEVFPNLTPSSVLYNGSDGAMFFPADWRPRNSKDPLSILFASRLVPEKGAHVLVEAVQLLNKENIPVMLRIAGSVSFGRTTGSSYIQQLTSNSPKNVEYLGYCTSAKIAEILRESDIFCLPSVWDDPFPLAPLEAMASAVPVLATRSGGIPEALETGGGILVSKGSAQELASAIAHLSGNRELLKTLAKSGRKNFEERFTWPHVLNNYRSIVREL